MTTSEILRLRLQNQHLAGKRLKHPEDVVKWLGAVQAQDYAGAKWGVMQRTQNTTSAALDQVFARGKILRTHIMRPTWHFVAAQDIRWLQALTAPRVKALTAYNNRQLKLDDAIFAKTNNIIAGALRGGQQLTRNELGDVLKQAGVDLGPKAMLCLAHIMLRAELDAIVCSGALRGKQHTYALLDERVPAGKVLSRQESVAELARRYFTSHGPATIKDYAWWSGLSMADAKAGLQAVQSSLTSQLVNGQTYWYDASLDSLTANMQSVYLLPNYDEYVVAYTDRSLLFDTKHTAQLDARQNPLFNNLIIADGQIVGTWKPATIKGATTIHPTTFGPLKRSYSKELANAIKRYANFINPK